MLSSTRKRGRGLVGRWGAFLRSLRRIGSKKRVRRGRTRKSRRRLYSGGAMYPNDDNTVIVDRADDSPDSVMRTRSYDSEMDNPIASQNSSV